MSNTKHNFDEIDAILFKRIQKLMNEENLTFVEATEVVKAANGLQILEELISIELTLNSLS